MEKQFVHSNIRQQNKIVTPQRVPHLGNIGNQLEHSNSDVLTGIDDDAYDGVSVADSAAPQQQVVGVETQADLIGLLPVG